MYTDAYLQKHQVLNNRHYTFLYCRDTWMEVWATICQSWMMKPSRCLRLPGRAIFVRQTTRPTLSTSYWPTLACSWPVGISTESPGPYFLPTPPSSVTCALRGSMTASSSCRKTVRMNMIRAILKCLPSFQTLLKVPIWYTNG